MNMENYNSSTVEKEVIPKNSKNTLAVMKVKRIPEGIRIYLESPILEKFFSMAGTDNDTGVWCNLRCYRQPVGATNPNGAQRDLLFHSFGFWRTNQLMPNNYPNLSMLRAIGLGNGVQFIIPTICSRTELKQFKDAFTREVMTLFREYIKSVDVSVEITVVSEGNIDAA